MANFTHKRNGCILRAVSAIGMCFIRAQKVENEWMIIISLKYLSIQKEVPEDSSTCDGLLYNVGLKMGFRVCLSKELRLSEISYRINLWSVDLQDCFLKECVKTRIMGRLALTDTREISKTRRAWLKPKWILNTNLGPREEIRKSFLSGELCTLYSKLWW